jgi:mono/diheme cytochrome c family protein
MRQHHVARLVLALALVLASTAAMVSTQGGALTATTPKRGGNPLAAKVANPVPPTDASIAAGRGTYQRLCARCHGREGKGDGGGAGAGGQPSAFTDDEWEFGSSDGEIFAAIAEGTSADMESYADRIAPTEIWNLVNYLRTLKP